MRRRRGDKFVGIASRRRGNDWTVTGNVIINNTTRTITAFIGNLLIESTITGDIGTVTAFFSLL